MLFDAHRRDLRFEPFAATYGIRTLPEAYDVQAAFVSMIVQSKGVTAVGYKIGLTSKRMQEFCKIDQPIAGVVLSDRVHRSGAEFSLEDFGHLGIEFEIGVRLGRDVVSARNSKDLVSAIDAVCPAIELVDDRNADYAALDVLSLVADNSWNGGIVLGEFKTVWPDLAAVQGVVYKDDVEIDRGTGRDVLGHPLEPLAWLVNHLAARGQRLRQGDIVLTGSLVTTRFPEPGHKFAFDIAGVGNVEITTRR